MTFVVKKSIRKPVDSAALTKEDYLLREATREIHLLKPSARRLPPGKAEIEENECQVTWRGGIGSRECKNGSETQRKEIDDHGGVRKCETFIEIEINNQNRENNKE